MNGPRQTADWQKRKKSWSLPPMLCGGGSVATCVTMKTRSVEMEPTKNKKFSDAVAVVSK